MSSEAIRCRHCGTAFHPDPREAHYCCSGCRAVHAWISEQGLEQFYDLKGRRVTEAVGNRVFAPVDWAWADALQARAETDADGPAATLGVDGLSCVACAWLIERRFRDAPGSGRIRILPERGTIELSWEPGRFVLRDFLEDILRFGYRATLPDQDRTGGRANELLVRLGLTGALALNTMAFTLPRYFGQDPASELGALCQLIALASSLLAVLTGGGYFIRRAWLAFRAGVLHIDLPISLGILVATGSTVAGWIRGEESLFYADFLATFIFLMLLGRWAQEHALGFAQRRVRQPPRFPAGSESLEPGRSYALAPGEIVPVESVLETEDASFGLEWITGEPDPVSPAPGEIVPAGAHLLSSAPRQLRARTTYADSPLRALLDDRPTPPDPLLDRVLRVYLILVLAVALIGGAAWLLAGEGVTAIQVAVSILVISCPCALGVAVPLLNARASRSLESAGVFVLQSSLWSRLRGLTAIVFDKTGTLTLPVPRLGNPEALKALTGEAREQLHHLVAQNRHPVGRCLHEALALSLPPGAPPDEETGMGVSRTAEDGCEWSLGRPGWKSPEGPGRVVLARAGEARARFEMDEAIRPDARQEVAHLRRWFPDMAILSGDRTESVRRIAGDIGMDPEDAYGNLTPGEKAGWLRSHGASHTMFIGDGLNDSLALDAAACGGLPATGTAIPVESRAGFLFFGSGLNGIRRLLETAARRRHLLVRVFLLAAGYNLAAVAVALTGHMSPLLAAVLMPLSSLATLAVAGSGWRRPAST